MQADKFDNLYIALGQAEQRKPLENKALRRFSRMRGISGFETISGKIGLGSDGGGTISEVHPETGSAFL